MQQAPTNSAGAARPMVSVQQLTKRYGTHEILKGINLDVAASEVLTLIGPSGSGKSTVLRCLNFLEAPTSGAVFVDGERLGYVEGKNGQLKRLPEAAMNRQRAEIGMVFQQFNLWPHKSVLENIIEAPMLVRGTGRDEAIETARPR